MDKYTKKCLAATTAADDIDMLIKMCLQAGDYYACNGTDTDPTVEIPDPTEHCKYWEEIGLTDLCDALEAKYKNADRLAIPAENLTEY